MILDVPLHKIIQVLLSNVSYTLFAEVKCTSGIRWTDLSFSFLFPTVHYSLQCLGDARAHFNLTSFVFHLTSF